MKRYELVFIDLDETLLDFKRAEREALELSFAGRGLAAGERVVLEYEEINRTVWAALERGEIDQESLKVERFRLLFGRMGLGLDPAAFSADYLRELGKGAYPLPGAVETCAWLAERYTLVAVTNGIGEVQRARLAASPIGTLLDAVAISGEAGCSKPDPGIFEYACGLAGMHERERMIMVGDSLASDMRGGANFGIDTCWYNPDGAPNPSGPRPTHEIRGLGELRNIL